ncbi:MAG: PP2C family protein-serine/threonine phosphatase [Planctomycetota bacterium]|jgi:sigma-B regulation protein RsbU (phosphoserine phosphatase)
MNESTLTIELNADGVPESLRIGLKKYPHELGGYDKLWPFLSSLGIRRLVLDSRLEINQITDVFMFLYSVRKKIKKSQNERPSGLLLTNLFSDKGVHIACTFTSVQNDKLNISYSYCVLSFSRFIHWFEKKQKTFRDHRALFNAAPRYAMLVGIFVLIPGLIFAYLFKSLPLALVTCTEAIILGSLVYAFLQSIGSVEYDNEEKSYHLQKTYRQMKFYNDRIIRDVKRARLVQDKFVPKVSTMPMSDRIEWASSFVPAMEVGGDYFDVRQISDEQIAILFSDVSGHGMSAAFITAILKTTFQTCIDNDNSLAELVEKLNTALYRLTPEDSFAAVFVAIFEASTNTFSYVNSGHYPQPWLISAKKNRELYPIDEAGTVILGIQERIKIESARCKLGPSDIVLFVSDGIIEAQNIDGDNYGLDEFGDLLKSKHSGSPSQLVDFIMDEIGRFSKDAEQMDDRTILAFQVKEQT